MQIVTCLPNPVFATIKQMNDAIKYCKKQLYIWQIGEFDYKTKRDPRFAYIYETKNFIHLCYLGKNTDKYEKKRKPYKWLYLILARDGVVNGESFNVYARSACGQFRRLTNNFIPDLSEQEWYQMSLHSAKPVLWFDDDYNLTKINIFEYDLNSAYGWGLKVAPLPDTRYPLGLGILEKNQIGWSWNGTLGLIGEECPYRFPLMSREDRKPIDLWVDRWYDLKRKAKNEADKARAKAYIVIPIGNFQNYNWFMRSAVIEFVNNYIMDLADRYDCVVKYNTDCLVTLKKIPELDQNIGNDIGQWKIEKEGVLEYNMHNEQWFDKEGKTIETKIRGVRKSCIGDDFNIELGNFRDSTIYYLDYDIYDVRKVVDINEALQAYLLQSN